ncbi:MAG TPA: vitamin B12 dependent-methionine synthase activation domain-containing protein [Bacteroidota bacterium]|nr:vitamin B12 dependent-methionine synthase activation domain-containing protein [Bacteroidota bacterium]
MSDAPKTRKQVYDPLTELMAYYATHTTQKRETVAASAPVEDRLRQRIIDGDKVGLQADLDEALRSHAALDIINTILLGGMKVVGELFGSGQMQLPFVLQSAEVMKSAVAYLEQFMDKAMTTAKGTMVLATVKGDVHDIGKNLVDIILTNNGYRVVNLGIKCPIETMLQSAAEHHAHAIGMSGLLVKSTLIMKENLEVMSERNITLPVILGGAALTRRYVEEDLRAVYQGPVLYANDAFDGLRYMEQIITGTLAAEASPAEDEEDRLTGTEAKIALARREVARHRDTPAPMAEGPAPRDAAIEQAQKEPAAGSRNPLSRSAVRTDVPVPGPPFWGTRVSDDIPLDDVFPFVNEVALIRGQWQVRKGKLSEQAYRELLKATVYPELERLKEQCRTERLLQPKAVHGYFPCQSDGNDLIIYEDDQRTERTRFTFPRQKGDRHLCLADYFASRASGRMDVVAMQLVTMGKRASDHSAELFRSNAYARYLYFHGLSVESAEALAELWHKRIREELGIAGKDAADIRRLFAQGYQGSRYSFGYPACPNLEDQTKLFALLDGKRIGVTLTDEFSLDPEQSTNAIIVHHPEARYFTIA